MEKCKKKILHQENLVSFFFFFSYGERNNKETEIKAVTVNKMKRANYDYGKKKKQQNKIGKLSEG